MLSSRERRQRGASLVELSLVLLILVLLLAGVIDFGRAFNSYIVVTNASREGAREASRSPNSETKIEDAVRQEAIGSAVDPDDLVITVDGLDAELGQPITVTVAYTVPTIIADIAGFGELPLRARTAMVVFGFEGQGQ
ncbi:MAG: TadE/TadG family type IV pilus assembly protein [Chloroflexota bacterium]